jgi:DNA replication and repair protein RecF
VSSVCRQEQSVLAAPSTRKTPPGPATPEDPACLWIERLRLTNFRNYASLSLETGAGPVVLTGPNGAGKTNLLEAVSLLAPGRGLRRTPFNEICRSNADPDAGWAIAARLNGLEGPIDVGTGFAPEAGTSGRTVRIDGVTKRSSGILGDHVRVVWLIPAMDGLFTGAAIERRRFLDRLIQTLDPEYRASLSRFERAMRQRNRLLDEHVQDPSQFEGLEIQMAEAGVAIAASRREAVARLVTEIEASSGEDNVSAFPWSTLTLEGSLEERLQHEAALDAEDAYRALLERNRERDRAARRTLDGPHRSDLIVGHGPNAMPARNCSTGEQKALLIGLVLAHSRLVQQASGGKAPLILLDEIVAHLDDERRRALFAEIVRLSAQAWMTGTDRELFAALDGEGQFLNVENGGVSA